MPVPAEGNLVEFDGGAGGGATRGGPGGSAALMRPTNPAPSWSAPQAASGQRRAMRRHAEARIAERTRRRAGVAPGLGGRSVKWDIRRKQEKAAGGEAGRS